MSRRSPVLRRGPTASPDLYFPGLTWQHTRGPALLHRVNDKAEHIAQHVGALAAKAAAPKPKVMA